MSPLTPNMALLTYSILCVIGKTIHEGPSGPQFLPGLSLDLTDQEGSKSKGQKSHNLKNEGDHQK